MNVKDFLFTYVFLLVLGALILLLILVKLIGAFLEQKWRFNTIRFHPLALISWLIACGTAIAISMSQQQYAETIGCVVLAVAACILYFLRVYVRYNEKEIQIYGIHGDCLKIPYAWLISVYLNITPEVSEENLCTNQIITIVYGKGGHFDDVGEIHIRIGWNIGSSRFLAYVSSRVSSIDES